MFFRILLVQGWSILGFCFFRLGTVGSLGVLLRLCVWSCKFISRSVHVKLSFIFSVEICTCKIGISVEKASFTCFALLGVGPRKTRRFFPFPPDSPSCSLEVRHCFPMKFFVNVSPE